jgi:DNA helicase TIP49 (TBP-interacting protein)
LLGAETPFTSELFSRDVSKMEVLTWEAVDDGGLWRREALAMVTGAVPQWSLHVREEERKCIGERNANGTSSLPPSNLHMHLSVENTA